MASNTIRYIEFHKRLNFYSGLPFVLPKWFERMPERYKNIWRIHVLIADIMTVLFVASIYSKTLWNVFDLDIVISNSAIVVFSLSIVIKQILFRKRKVELNKIVQELERTMERNDNNPFHDYTFEQFYDVEYGFIRKLTKILLSWNLPSAILFYSYYAVTTYMEKDESKWEYPAHSFIPTPPNENPYLFYSLKLLFLNVGFFYIQLRLIPMDTLFLSVLKLIVVQLKYQRHLAGKIVDDVPHLTEVKLTWWIEQHQATTRILDDFTIISSPYMIITYTVVLFEIFIVAILVTLMTTWNWFHKSVTSAIISGLLLQLYLICRVGDDYDEQGNAIAHDCNLDQLITKDNKTRKSLLFVLTRSNKALTITAGGLYPLSSRTFGQLVNTVFSAYVTIKQIGQKRNHDDYSNISTENK